MTPPDTGGSLAILRPELTVRWEASCSLDQPRDQAPDPRTQAPRAGSGDEREAADWSGDRARPQLRAVRPGTIGPVVGSPALAAGSGTLTNEKEREAPMRAHTHSPEFAPRDEAGPMLDRGALLSSDRGDVGNLRRIQPSEFYGLFATLATAPTETHGKNVGAPFSDVKLQVGALFFALV